MLEMKTHCEHCQSVLEAGGEAYICSYECTFCTECRTAFEGICPNCAGELIRRPRREPRGEDA